MTVSPATPPPLLRSPLRIVGRRPGAWGRLIAFRLFLTPFLLVGVACAGAMVIAVAWAGWGTDHSARVIRASSAPGNKGRIVYRATYAYDFDGQPREASSEVAAGTYLAYRGAPNEPVFVKVRSIGRPPLIYDAVIDTPGKAWRGALFVCAGCTFWCLLCVGFYRESFVKPRRIKRLYRSGTVAPGTLGPGREERGKGTAYYVTYRFRTPDGRTREGETSVSKREWETRAFEGTEVWVLYDPARPRHNIVVGYGPYRCEG